MPNAVTGFSAALLKLAIQLSVAAYNNDFTSFDGEMIYKNRTDGFLAPVFYVYKLDGNLWLVNRGSITQIDYLSCAEFNERTTDLGTFHEGFWIASETTLSQAAKYIEEFDGTVYITGHSYGASVAPVEYVILRNKFPHKDINCLAFGPVPMMDNVTSEKYRDKLVTVINHFDLVPTLSVPNVWNTFSYLEPVISQLPKDQIIDVLEKFLDYFEWGISIIDKMLYEALKADIPALVDAVIGYTQGEQRLIRYPAGHVYQINIDKPKPIDECEVEPTSFDSLSTYIWAMTEHPDKVYENAVMAIPDNRVRN
ncbi:lipase [Tritrichomonas foetus]|uniref:Lipase n=1 Tax=Tritrichomonas foetus TaxID=1144522 RepID=A0A1J4JBS8_9EUKA|nr:lipase [Tritrichomonas foetus]|eukprot:OHS96600.1 lipase [Tritrichomonas foetus]